MCSALTVGHSYAAELRNLQDRNTELKLRNTELLQCDEPGRTQLKDQIVQRMAHFRDRTVWLGNVYGMICLAVGLLMGICSQGHLLEGLLRMGWFYAAVYLFIITATCQWRFTIQDLAGTYRVVGCWL